MSRAWSWPLGQVLGTPGIAVPKTTPFVITRRDSFIPFGDAALKVLLDEDTIEAAAIKLTAVSRSPAVIVHQGDSLAE